MFYLWMASLPILKNRISAELAHSIKPKKCHSFLGLASYYRHFIPICAAITSCLHELVGPTHVKKDGKIFSHLFEIGTDASLQGLEAVLSHRDEHGRSRLIVYACQFLHSNERKMRNHSSAKLELLMLKWAMMDKLWDYLLGSKYTMYMDNNPLAYVRESRLGLAQIRWLRELVLFDSDIKYRTGKLNKAGGSFEPLSLCPRRNGQWFRFRGV